MMDCTEELPVDVAGPQNEACAAESGACAASAASFAALRCDELDLDVPTGASDALGYGAGVAPAAASPTSVAGPHSALSRAASELQLVVSQLAAMFSAEAAGRPAIRPLYVEEVHRGQLLPAYRKQIVDWMFEVGSEFNLSRTATFAAVQLFDRFLSRQQVRPSELQMLALACVIVASKVNDTNALKMVRDVFVVGWL